MIIYDTTVYIIDHMWSKDITMSGCFQDFQTAP